MTAADRSAKRLRRLEDNLRRTGLRAKFAVTDALDFVAAEPFDAVLLDAPCSATGTLRRRPDVAWSKSEADIAALAELQAKLIAAAAKLVKPGGRLVFCTCSLEPEEGPGAVSAALRDGLPLEPEPIMPEELPGLPDAITPDGFMRTLPSLWADRGGMDGFFVARFRVAV